MFIGRNQDLRDLSALWGRSAGVLVTCREIKHSVIDEVAEKVRRLRHRRDLSIRTALVYEGELAKTIPADHYFDFLVPVEKLLLP